MDWENLSRIRAQISYSALGTPESYSCAWVEPQKRFAAISHELLDQLGYRSLRTGDKVILGGLCLRMIEFDCMRSVWFVARDGWRAIVYQHWFAATRWLDLIYRRFIITLAVWHLAEYHSQLMPTWRDIYALARLSNAFAKIKRYLRGGFPRARLN